MTRLIQLRFAELAMQSCGSFLCMVFGLAFATSSRVHRQYQPIPKEPPAVESEAFARELARVGKVPWTGGNQIVSLENGFFPTDDQGGVRGEAQHHL